MGATLRRGSPQQSEAWSQLEFGKDLARKKPQALPPRAFQFPTGRGVSDVTGVTFGCFLLFFCCPYVMFGLLSLRFRLFTLLCTGQTSCHSVVTGQARE